MGRFSASGARLHELRQPKPANAALCQSLPSRSHGSSLGLEHPQSAIRPACRDGPTLDVDVIEPPPVPPAQRWLDPPRRPRGAFHASSPWGPTGRMPAQAPRGCCPRRAAARRLPGISADKPSKEALHRRPIGGTRAKAPQRCKALRRLRGGSRAASMPHARGRTCPKGPENGLGRAAAPTQAHGAQCGTGEAP